MFSFYVFKALFLSLAENELNYLRNHTHKITNLSHEILGQDFKTLFAMSSSGSRVG
jgi:hypothetical protein